MTIHRHLLTTHIAAAAAAAAVAAAEGKASGNGELLNRQMTNGNSSTSSSIDVSSLKRSLSSLLSTHSYTTTPEYSPQLITGEVGKLLSVDDLDVLDNPSTYTNRHLKHKSRTKFDLISDTNTTDDTCSSDTDDGNDEIEPYFHHSQPLQRVSTSTHCCVNDHNEFSREKENFNDPIWDFKTKWAIVLIGLPASGKSTVIRHLIDFINLSTNDKVRMKSFNAGDVRRRYEMMNDKFDFNFDNEESLARRDFYAFEALNDLTTGLTNDTIDIGIFDATNTTIERRERVFDKIQQASKGSNIKIHPILFEVKCQNRALRRFNIEQKANNNDYKNMPKDQAIIDFLERIKKYELIYEAVTVDEIMNLGVKYFAITNVGEAIYYDCGLKHHDSKRHQMLKFKYLALNLIYQFLITYRETYAPDYLENVRVFYNEGHYKPVNTKYSKPVTDKDTKFQNNVTTKIPKVLSSSRMIHDEQKC